MKQILKSLVLLLVFTVFSCQEDNATIISAENFSSQRFVNLNDLNNNPNLVNKILEFKNINETLKYSKNSKDENINYIDFDKILEIVKDGKTSYTIPFYRNLDSNSQENLLISLVNKYTYRLFIVKYDLTDQDKINLIKNQPIQSINEKTSIEVFSAKNNTHISNKLEAMLQFSDGTCGYYDHSSYSTEDTSVGTVYTVTNYYNIGPCSGDSSTGGNGTGTGYTPNYVGSSGPFGSGSGGSYSGNGGPRPGGGSNATSNYYTVVTQPVIVLKTSKQIEIEFKSKLNTAQLAWWNNINNQLIKNKIITYLTVNQIYDIDDNPEDFIKDLINAVILNPLSINDYAIASPNFKMKKIDQLRYPKFTQMVKNLKANVQNNPSVLAALIMHSGLTEAQVLNKLTFGQGPLIELVPNLTGRYGRPNYGNFKSDAPNAININENFALGMQNAQLNSTLQATSFLLAITILHEFVHYGNLLTGVDTNGNEMGNLFETAIYGVLITKDNAGNYLTEFK